MEPYRLGYCAHCDTQIMVKDTNGLYNSYKDNYRQVKIYTEKDHYIQLPVCSTCSTDIDYETILKRITHEGSQARLHPSKKEKFLKIIQNKKKPDRIEMPKDIFQGNKMRGKRNANRS